MNKLIIITGTTSGLGLALVNKLILEKDFDIISISRKKPKIEKNSKFKHLNVDLSKFPDIDILNRLESEISAYKKVFFINNAFTIDPIKKFGAISNEEIQAALLVNVITPTIIINRIVQICQNKELKIINISSGAAKKPIDSWSIYSSSKAYMNMLFESIQNDYLAVSSIRAFDFEPGVIDTGMQEKIRNSSSSAVFVFKDLKTENKLKAPIDVALEVLDLINL